MLLLHIVAVLAIAAALILLTARAALAVVARRGRTTRADARLGVHSGISSTYLWIGPLVVSRYPWPEAGATVQRFHGFQGPARTVSVYLGGVQWHADMHDSTARLWLMAPHLLLSAWLGLQLGQSFTRENTLRVLGVIVLSAAIAALLRRLDVLTTDLHYAHRGSDLDQHEAWHRGRTEGIRYETERQRFATGERYDAPAYPSSPYAA